MSMKIDLHVHSNGSDGKFTVEEIFAEARSRGLGLLSITDHDSVSSQGTALALAGLAENADIKYLTGVELNVTFSHPDYREGKEIYLDFLGYGFDINNHALVDKLEVLREFREMRAKKILANLNVEFEKEGRELFDERDLAEIKATVDGAFGRPHIADHLVRKGIVGSRQEAFDQYLMKCYEPKFPLKLQDAAGLVHNAGGILVFAHGNDPSGTSLVKYTTDLTEQVRIIEENFLEHIDGLECWHSRHDERTTEFYIELARKHGLVMTGGTDCHQKPLRMGTLDIPEFVASQFEL